MISSLIRGFNQGDSASPSSYLEFSSSTPMTITPKYTNSGVTLQYKIGSGVWTNISSGVTTPSDNVIMFRGVATGTKSLFTSQTSSNAWSFSSATNLEVRGNINSLIQDVLGGSVLNIPLSDNCYSSMFRNTPLVTAPELPSTTLSIRCYMHMFYECSSLVTVPKLPATTLASYCYDSMFLDCTSLVTAPKLPATTLANYCYRDMYRGCTSLATLPELPATTLTNYCYNSMFSYCTNIKLSSTKTGIYQTAYRIPTTGTGTLGTSSLVNMFLGTGGTFTNEPSINTTYYTANTIV